MRVVIVANGPSSDGETIRTCAAEADRTIVTDGAIHSLPEDVIPHVVCGDFDSADIARARLRYPHIDYIHLDDQDANDLEKAIEYACSQGATDIVILSAIGGRPDHTLASYLLLMKYADRVFLEIREAGMRCFALRARKEKTASLSCTPAGGAVVSLLPWGNDACVSISGVQWPLRDQVLPVGSLGVSNKAVDASVTVTVHTGSVLVFYAYESF